MRPSYESLIDATVLNFAFSQRFPISFIRKFSTILKISENIK